MVVKVRDDGVNITVRYISVGAPQLSKTHVLMKVGVLSLKLCLVYTQCHRKRGSIDSSTLPAAV